MAVLSRDELDDTDREIRRLRGEREQMLGDFETLAHDVNACPSSSARIVHRASLTAVPEVPLFVQNRQVDATRAASCCGMVVAPMRKKWT